MLRGCRILTLALSWTIKPFAILNSGITVAYLRDSGRFCAALDSRSSITKRYAGSCIDLHKADSAYWRSRLWRVVGCLFRDHETTVRQSGGHQSSQSNAMALRPARPTIWRTRKIIYVLTPQRRIFGRDRKTGSDSNASSDVADENKDD